MSNFNILDDELASPESSPESPVRYAGPAVRLMASIVDSFVTIPLSYLYHNGLLEPSMTGFMLALLSQIIYKPFMEYYWGATIGKLVMGIKVVNLQYQPINLLQAAIRYIPWFLSILPALLGLWLVTFHLPPGLIDIFYFLSSGHIAKILSATVFISVLRIFFSTRYRCFHDLLAGTYCIYK